MTNDIVPTVVAPPAVHSGLLVGSTPKEFIAAATAIGKQLRQVITNCELVCDIKGRPYVKCEGWTTMAALCGLFPSEVSNTDLTGDGSRYVAVVELVTDQGRSVGRASAECGMDEALWADRDAYARRSMAATRATAKACRIRLAWLMKLAGYEPTPYEEMPLDDGRVPPPTRKRALPPADDLEPLVQITPAQRKALGKNGKPHPAAQPIRKADDTYWWALSRKFMQDNPTWRDGWDERIEAPPPQDYEINAEREARLADVPF